MSLASAILSNVEDIVIQIKILDEALVEMKNDLKKMKKTGKTETVSILTMFKQVKKIREMLTNEFDPEELE